MGSLREQLASSGYAVLRGILDAGAVAALRSRVIDAARGHGWVTGDEGTPTGRAPREGGDGWWHGYASVQGIEELHRLGHDRQLAGTVAEALGSPVLSHSRRVVSLTLPGYGTPPHQDYVSVQGSVDTLTAWAPLDDREGDSAALRLLEGRQQPRLRQLEWVDGITARVPVTPADTPWAQPRLRAGDVVVYHGFTLHELRPNLDEEYRIACEFRFQPLSDPVCRASLMPHHHPRVPGWPTLTDGWRSTSWVETPEGVTFAPFRLPRRIEDWHAELPVPPSRLLTPSDARHSALIGQHP